MRHGTIWVESIEDWVGILVYYIFRVKLSWGWVSGAHLAQASSEYDHFVDLSHTFEKFVNSRPLKHIEVMPVCLNLYWNYVIW